MMRCLLITTLDTLLLPLLHHAYAAPCLTGSRNFSGPVKIANTG